MHSVRTICSVNNRNGTGRFSIVCIGVCLRINISQVSIWHSTMLVCVFAITPKIVFLCMIVMIEHDRIRFESRQSNNWLSWFGHTQQSQHWMAFHRPVQRKNSCVMHIYKIVNNTIWLSELHWNTRSYGQKQRTENGSHRHWFNPNCVQSIAIDWSREIVFAYNWLCLQMTTEKWE